VGHKLYRALALDKCAPSPLVSLGQKGEEETHKPDASNLREKNSQLKNGVLLSWIQKEKEKKKRKGKGVGR
jgi:hypothetical protein